MTQQTWISIGPDVFGAKPDDRGPIGGGSGYQAAVTTGDLTATTVDQLLAALAVAAAGQTIFIPGDAELDFTERVYLDKLQLMLPGGVTLASDRGHNGSAGALLASDALQTCPLIQVAGAGARITGLRVRGPDPKRRLDFHHRVFAEPGEKLYPSPSAAYYALPNSDGIAVDSDRLEVDNCEIAAWSHGGIYLRAGCGHHIHHCFVHHCQRMGLGYGICMNAASDALIAGNLFQDNKHHIAGTGSPGQCYEAAHNVVLPYTESHRHPVTGAAAYGQDHLFDMHGGRDRQDHTEIAGGRLHIHHNTFFPGYCAVNIRGVPQEEARVDHNWFVAHHDTAGAVISDGRTVVEANHFGASPDS